MNGKNPFGPYDSLGRRKTAENGTRYRIATSDRVRFGGTSYRLDNNNNDAYRLLPVPQRLELPSDTNEEPPNPWLDWDNILLLTFLYVLQGIPMGLSGSIPLVLSSKVSFGQQALFSLVAFPFSLKLLWAPIVDSVYFPKIGRRKSWLIPTQFLCGMCMLCGAAVLNEWIGDTGNPPSMYRLTAYFFFLFFLMATQDIALDGWALTVLQRRNIGYASTCNSVGQTIGYYIANVGFLALHSADVSNKYFRLWSEPQLEGIISLSSFSCFWGIVFLISTFGVWLCKHEKHDISEDDIVGTWDVYKQLYHCIKLPNVQWLCLVLLTSKISSAVTDAGTVLKFIEFGMTKEFPALFAPVLALCGVVMPIIVSYLLSYSGEFVVYVLGFKLRLVVAWMYIPLLLVTTSVFANDSFPGWPYTISLIVVTFVNQVGANFQFVSIMAFFSRISDPTIGGTYMTLLNTANNLGYKWATSLSLFLIDPMTIHNKSIGTSPGLDCQLGQWVKDGVKCDGSLTLDKLCRLFGTKCHIKLDGYYVQVLVCTGIGVVWLKHFKHILNDLEGAPLEEWHVYHHHHDNSFSPRSSEDGKMGKIV